MSGTGVIDHVTEGLAGLRPRAARDPAVRAILTVLLLQVQQLDDLLVTLCGLWTLDDDRAPLWVLIQIGNLLGVPYSPAYPKELYRQLLRARRVARRSRGTYDDVVRLADELRGKGTIDHATVNVSHPEAMQIGIPNLPKILEDKVRALILPYIQETTDLSVIGITDTEGGAVPQEWLILSPPEVNTLAPGAFAGKLADPL